MLIRVIGLSQEYSLDLDPTVKAQSAGKRESLLGKAIDLDQAEFDRLVD